MKLKDIVTESTVKGVSNNKFADMLRNLEVGVDFDSDNLVNVPLGKAVFVDEEGYPVVSLEHSHTAGAVGDYYGEFRGGFPWVSDELEKFAEKHGRHIEWVNPGAIGFYD